MKHLIFFLSLFLLAASLSAQTDQVKVVDAADGSRLMVNGQPMMINGMNWDYFPIGTNFNYSLWNESDAVVRAALDKEMSLLQNMGVNAVRMYTGVPPKWIAYIYEKYGIYTMLNHSFGRYGLTIEGSWVAITDYREPKTKELLMSEATKLAEQYKNTPGLLLYLLGNENNYGLFWAGAETEAFPEGEEQLRAVGEARGRPMYKLMNDAAKAMKSIDGSHPVAICNGDLLFIDIVAEECTDVDIYGTNMYRGVSFTDAFDRVKKEYGKPIMFTEFGADAFNAISNEEDQEMQAYYMVNNWQDIYANAAGMGKAGNSLGGFTFQFSDGWWKFGQTKNLDVHDANASWPGGGYTRDLVEGENNMNEEWFGICAKGPTNERGLYDLYPRASYYALQEAHNFNPYATGQSEATLKTHFSKISLMGAVLKGRGDKAALAAQVGGGKLSISRFTANLAAVTTGGDLISTPNGLDPDYDLFPNRQGFDHMQSFFVGVKATPAPNVRAEVQFNILGNVATTPINEIFYENRGRPVTVETTNGQVVLGDANRVAVYRADFEWNHELFDMKGFYRTGHYHWAYEGDFFGLYPEANYGPNIDIYNGTAPLGAEFYGKKAFKGLAVAIGPELWWGANPAIIAKYTREIAGFEVTGMFHEDLEQRVGSESSFAVPIPKTRRASLYAEKEYGALGVHIGGLWGGQPLVGRTFQLMNPEMGKEGTDMTPYEDVIRNEDLWGGKI
ncbi:MAG: glycoside hydrolase family 2 TIM barrel-domain containing protein, partial [Bacteroidota bacterium]